MVSLCVAIYLKLNIEYIYMASLCVAIYLKLDIEIKCWQTLV